MENEEEQPDMYSWTSTFISESGKMSPLNTSSTWNLYFMVFRVMGCWSESWGEGSKKLRLFLKTLEGSRMSRGRILIAGAADRVNTLSARPLNAASDEQNFSCGCLVKQPQSSTVGSSPTVGP